FPYSVTGDKGAYDGAKCNGADYPKSTGVTTLATGVASTCKSDLDTTMTGDELYDMSGNVKEWVTSTTATSGYEMRGGAYNIDSFYDGTAMPPVTKALGLQCDASSPAPTGVDVRLPSVG